MSDDERIEHLELEVKVLRENNKGLKDKIDEQSKEIEELKKNKGYHLGFIDGGIAKRYEMEDKIKAKTIEIKNRPVKDEFITASQGKLNAIIDMESLLEKE